MLQKGKLRKSPGGAPQNIQGLRVVLDVTDGLCVPNVTCDYYY